MNLSLIDVLIQMQGVKVLYRTIHFW